MKDAEQYWKKLEHDQQILLNQQFKRKQRQNEYMNDLERQIVDRQQMKIAKQIDE